MSITITRYAAPSEFDQWPVGTQCRVYIKDNEYEVYIQRNKDEDHPIWEYTGIEYING
jgi:hypothetical protein